MTLIADTLLIAGALAAAFYCWILSARVKSLKDLDNGLGAAIAALSGKVDEMQTALRVTQKATDASHSGIEAMTERANKAAEDLSDLLNRVEASSQASAKPAPQKKRSRRTPSLEEQRRKLVTLALEDPEDTETEEDFPQGLDEDEIAASPRDAQPVALTNAQKLQSEIRARLADRKRQSTEAPDEVVQTIQSLLVAARK